MTDHNPVTITMPAMPGRSWGSPTTFTFSDLTIASVVAIARIISENNLTDLPDQNMLQAVDMERDAIAEIIAIAIRNRDGKYSDKVKRQIIDRFEAQDLLQVLNVVVRKMDFESFGKSFDLLTNGTPEIRLKLVAAAMGATQKHLNLLTLLSSQENNEPA